MSRPVSDQRRRGRVWEGSPIRIDEVLRLRRLSVTGGYLPRRHQRPQPSCTLGRAQLPQCFGFNLPDALARDVEFLADLFECVLALAADAEAQPDHFLL